MFAKTKKIVLFSKNICVGTKKSLILHQFFIIYSHTSTRFGSLVCFSEQPKNRDFLYRVMDVENKFNA